MLDADTQISAASYEIARLAAGGALAGVDAIMNDKADNVFCAVRPPGHHALAEKAMGFCLFNNAAVAARYIQQKYSLNKVLIIDWDVHHGNGTYEIFIDDPSVFYFSVHQFPHYPNSGTEDETGIGEGLGYSLHVTFSGGQGDREYIAAFKEKLLPKAREFAPDFIIISAGFDAHKDDSLSGMQLSAEGFGELTHIISQLADETCNGRIVSVLEGGYNLTALAESVFLHIQELKS